MNAFFNPFWINEDWRDGQCKQCFKAQLSFRSLFVCGGGYNDPPMFGSFTCSDFVNRWIRFNEN